MCFIAVDLVPQVDHRALACRLNRLYRRKGLDEEVISLGSTRICHQALQPSTVRKELWNSRCPGADVVVASIGASQVLS